MDNYSNIVQFDSEELAIIKKDVNQIWKQELTNWFKNLFINSKCIITMYFILIIAGLMLMITGILAFLCKEKVISINAYFFIYFLIIGAALAIISLLFLWISNIIQKKIKSAFQNQNHKYIKMAFKNVFKDVIVNDILNDFTLEPQNFLIKYGNWVGNKVVTEKVLLGTINGQLFNCGTVMHTIKQKNNTIYNRYLYFTFLIDNIDFTTTIKPKTLGSKITSSSFINQLESAELEKLFTFDDSDPIKLRKLLVPKVMTKILDLATNSKTLPKIFINKNQVTIRFDYKNISSAESDEGNLVNFILEIKVEKMLENIIDMLNKTIELFINSYVWISSLDLNEELNFHRNT